MPGKCRSMLIRISYAKVDFLRRYAWATSIHQVACHRHFLSLAFGAAKYLHSQKRHRGVGLSFFFSCTDASSAFTLRHPFTPRQNASEGKLQQQLPSSTSNQSNYTIIGDHRIYGLRQTQTTIYLLVVTKQYFVQFTMVPVVITYLITWCNHTAATTKHRKEKAKASSKTYQQLQ